MPPRSNSPICERSLDLTLIEIGRRDIPQCSPKHSFTQMFYRTLSGGQTPSSLHPARMLQPALHPRTAPPPPPVPRNRRSIAGAPPAPRVWLRPSPCPGGSAPNRDRRCDRGVCRRSWQQPAPRVPFWHVDGGVFPPVISCPCRESAGRRLEFSGKFKMNHYYECNRLSGKVYVIAYSKDTMPVL